MNKNMKYKNNSFNWQIYKNIKVYNIKIKDDLEV